LCESDEQNDCESFKFDEDEDDDRAGRSLLSNSIKSINELSGNEEGSNKS
jgi:hypothetical protein